MNNVSKLLRGNVVTATIVTVVLSVNDLRQMVNGKISGAQGFKNITTTAAGVAGGAGGMMAGAKAGAVVGSVVPGIGTGIGAFVGGVIGTFVGSSAASSATHAVLDEIIEDDAKAMLEIFNETLARLAYEYLLFENDLDAVIELIQQMDMGDELRNMYASPDPAEYAWSILEPIVFDVAAKRPMIKLPSVEEVISASRLVVEELADPNSCRAMTEQSSVQRNTANQIWSMQRNEREFVQRKQQLMQERAGLQEDLADLLRDSK